MNKKYNIFPFAVVIFLMTFLSVSVFSQTASLSGFVTNENNEPLPYTFVKLTNTNTEAASTEKNGRYEFKILPFGDYSVSVYALGFKALHKKISISEAKNYTLDFKLEMDTISFQPITVRSQEVTLPKRPIAGLADIEATAIYAGKKNEVISIENVQGNTAANTSRQLFAKVPGIHIQENDGGGIQLSISARGLNPSRMLEFNVRQNGYDIAADALGYPESYYTPPAFALKRIEVVRGASSLQYGPQFGGLINFVMKTEGKKTIEGQVEATYGSFNFIALNASVGGKKGKFNYYGFIGKRRGDGWRQNTGFDITNGFAHIDFQAHKSVNIGLEYTGMIYTMQQPGGLTDKQFAQNPRQSLRDRNWFTSSWNVFANTFDIKISEKSKINIRNFLVMANRYSIGNLNAMTEVDTGGYRNLQKDDYLNFGSEIRFMHTYKIKYTKNTLLTGARIYRGSTHRMQGLGSAGTDANFSFNHPHELEDSDFRFPSWNAAAFAENVFYLPQHISITPGVRVEFIQTTSNGYYMANGSRAYENKNRNRVFALGGLGVAYKPRHNMELYANFSQNYSAVNFNDIRVNNPNLRVDPTIHDVSGFNADLGYRGYLKSYLNYDVSLYYLYYKGRIGTITQYDQNFEIYQYRTNISDSRNIGAEAFVEFMLMRALQKDKIGDLNMFVSGAYTDARYVHSQNKSLEGKFVELAPRYIIRAGISYKIKGFSTQFQYAYTAQQFTDANNTVQSASGITGIIPAYAVADLSASYTYKLVKLSTGCNNILNAKYFTRRASGYPGPGILPSDPRNFYVTLNVKF